MDLKQVHNINQKYKDTVFGFIRKIQALLPDTSSYFNIVELIQHLILLYYYHRFESVILNDEQQEDFLNLLQENNKSIGNFSWNLIYRASIDKMNRESFIEKVHGRDNVLVFIQTKDDYIVGGFTSIGWDKELIITSNDQHSADKDAFVFHVKSGNNPEKCYKSFICNVKQDENSWSKALGYRLDTYCAFGDTWVFYVISDNQLRQQHPVNYEALPEYMPRGCIAIEYDVLMKEIEVFQKEC